MEEFLSNHGNYTQLIIPTVMIPLTALSVALTVVASFIAGLFGISLSTEGPKRLLEVLLKPKVLLSGLILNLLILGGVKGYDYVKNLPAFLWKVKSTQSNLAKPSDRVYEDRKTFPLNYDIAADLHADNNETRLISIEKNKEKNQALEKQLSPIWQIKLDRGNFRSPVLSGGSIFIGGDSGYVYELDQADGKEIRKFFVGTMITPELTIFDQTLYVGEGTHNTHHARVYSFDLKTGAFKHAYETKGHTEGQPVVGSHQGKDLLFVVSGGDGLHAVDPKTMELVWHVNDGHIDASALPWKGMVFAGTGRDKGNNEKYRTYANAYEFETGKRLWQKELPASSWMSPVAWKDSVCFIFGEVYFPSGIGGVYCFQTTDGTPTHAFNLSGPQTGLPIVIGDNLFSTGADGRVCSLNLNSKSIDWCHAVKSKGKSFSSPSYAKDFDALVYASKEDGLWLLDRKDGQVMTHLLPSDWKTTFGAAAVVNKYIAVGDIEGNTRYLKISDQE